MKLSKCLIFLFAVNVCFFSAGCINRRLKPAEKNEQMDQLREIQEVEKKITDFCLSQRGISDVQVYVRSQKAIIFLEPEKNIKRDRKTINQVSNLINAFVLEKTGLKRDQIIMKFKDRIGGGE